MRLVVLGLIGGAGGGQWSLQQNSTQHWNISGPDIVRMDRIKDLAIKATVLSCVLASRGEARGSRSPCAGQGGPCLQRRRRRPCRAAAARSRGGRNALRGLGLSPRPARAERRGIDGRGAARWGDTGKEVKCVCAWVCVRCVCEREREQKKEKRERER